MKGVDEVEKLMPEEMLEIKLSNPIEKAVGMPAVISSIKHVLAEMPASRGFKALNYLNQFDGVDCPGCAWPDPDDERSALGEYCENGAKAIAEEATTKLVTPDFFAQHSIEEMLNWTDYELGKSGRITHPMYLPQGGTHYQPIKWDEAFNLIARNLNQLNSPHEAIFYTSGRTSNEAAFLYQLFVRSFGTNNLPDCSNMCHESSGVALGETIGIGKGTVKLEDFYHTDLIIIAGQNPGTNHPRMLSALKKAKRNGAKIIAINPMREAGLISYADPQTASGLLGQYAPLADLYLQVKINADLSLFKAIAKIIQKRQNTDGNIFDLSFIKDHTHGYDEYIKSLDEYSIEELISHTGLDSKDVYEAADLIALKPNIILCWAMGWTQHKNAVETIQEGVNLLLLKGSIGKPFAGACPVRGHSNVQGDRTMGIYEKPPKAFLDRLDEVYDTQFPRENGFDTVEAILAMKEGNGKVFIAMGGNYLSATPDTVLTANALRNTRLTVQISTKLNRSHVVHGSEALILPCYGRTDLDIKNEVKQFVTVEDSMGVVHQSNGNLNPTSDQMLSEVEIVVRIAKATLKKNVKINWDDYLNHYDHIRNDIEKSIPGFNDYNKRVRQKGGFYLPNAARYNEYNTGTGKANFTVTTPEPFNLNKGEMIMMTVRSHDQFNTTIYGLNDRYRGITNERRVIFVNEMEMKKRGLGKLEKVNLVSTYGGIRRIVHNFLVIPYNLPNECCASYFPETNPLVPITETAKKSNTPISKSVIITIEKQS